MIRLLKAGLATIAAVAVGVGPAAALCKTVPGGPTICDTVAPEIDASAGIAAIAVLIAVSLIVRELFARRSRQA